jgi:hypothetical protein
VACEKCFADYGSGVVASGGGLEYGSVDRVGQESSPRAVGGDAAGHLGWDGAVSGEFAGVVVEAEQGGGGDEHFDVWAASMLVRESTAEPVDPVV